jgi:hypothetical protein
VSDPLGSLPPEGTTGLPPLAGLCTLAAAQSPGLSVDECVARLKRFHYVLRRLHQLFVARITAEPHYELKTAFSLHGYLCAEHVSALRKRVGEMREPPLGLEEVPHPALQAWLDELLSAPTSAALVAGLYEVAVPELLAALERYQQQTNPLVDAPSRRVLRFAILELEDLRQFGRAAAAAVVGQADRRELAAWRERLAELLAAAGGLDGTAAPAESVPEPYFARQPFEYQRVPRRDARFQDGYNAGVNPEAFLYDEAYAARDKTLMMYYKRLREIDVPEMMSSIIHESPQRPWAWHHDLTRQLWDEARHAMMGEVGFVSLGLDWSQIPINFTWSLNLNTQLSPTERHAVLYFIEQGLMPRTGKRYEWEVGLASGDPLARLFQDFDWADEVLHAHIGRQWYVADFASPKEAIDYGDRCWSRVLSHWRQYREDGLTEHRNWWPDLYRQACRRWGVEPDPRALAFHVTYETQRADLQAISSSG